MADRKLEIHYAEEWAALYVDGKLEQVGDSYLAEQRAFELLGVRTVHDDAFMRGQSQESGVAPTLDDVTKFRVERTERRDEADRLRAEAARLAEQARTIEAEWS